MANRVLKPVLPAVLLACSLTVFLPLSGASGETLSRPQNINGFPYWQPRFAEFASQDPSPPGLSDHPHLTRLTPSDCSRLLDLLAGDVADFRASMLAWDHFLLQPCLLHVLQKTARPAPVGGINMTDPVPDIVERLDIGSFRWSLGPALPDGQGAVTLRYFFGAPGTNPDAVLTRRQDSFEYLSRYEGKESWFRKLSLLAAADWTGDGKGELLVSWEDDNLGRGTYNTISLLLLGAESSDTPITAMHVEDWLFKGREAVLRMLK